MTAAGCGCPSLPRGSSNYVAFGSNFCLAYVRQARRKYP